MSQENIVKFQEKLMESPELQQKLIDARMAEDVIAVAKAEGFAFSAEELEEYSKTAVIKGKLSDDELGEVTGGLMVDGHLETTVGYGCKYWEASEDLWLAAKGACGSCKKWRPGPSIVIFIGAPGFCTEDKNSTIHYLK
jgi:predicted ribosomally synthesized peptide with nif11-like leader